MQGIEAPRTVLEQDRRRYRLPRFLAPMAEVLPGLGKPFGLDSLRRRRLFGGGDSGSNSAAPPPPSTPTRTAAPFSFSFSSPPDLMDGSS